jgi:predicted metal-dependent phosphoesterase TrpH
MVATLPLLQSAQDINALKAVWSRIDAKSCPYDFNFHLHTRHSDGQLSPVAIIEQAIAIGLQGLAITDHHAISGFYAAQAGLEEAVAQENVNLPHLWTGIEITALLLDTEVHILGYGFDPTHEAMTDYLQGDRPQGEAASARTVIKALHEAGGLVVLAHPERYRRPASELVPVAAELGINGVETYYAYNNPKPWRPSDRETRQVFQLAQQHALYSTCGTDTHGQSLLIRL